MNKTLQVFEKRARVGKYEVCVCTGAVIKRKAIFPLSYAHSTYEL